VSAPKGRSQVFWRRSAQQEHPVIAKQPSSIHIQPPSNAASKQSGYTNNVPPRGPQRQAKSARQQRGSGEQ
jgi:hypothetical protein